MVSYILREWLITATLHLQLMSVGINIAFPSILAPALIGNQTDIKATQDEVDMIMGAFGILGTFAFLIFPAIMQLYGRKVTIITLNAFTVTGSVIVALACNVPMLVAGRFLQSCAFGGYYMSSLVAAEYINPKRRGFQIVLKGMFAGLGELLCHSLGLTILTYKQVAWMAVIPSSLSILITLKWPESPSFLAYKGRYDECTKAFEWMRGKDPAAKNELHELILFQKESKKRDASSKFVTRVLQTFRKKDFLIPLLLSTLLTLKLQTTGATTLAFYITEILNKLAGDRSKAFYYTIGLDVMRILAQVISCCVVRLVRRRVVLFSASSVSCSLMVLLIVLYYLDKVDVIQVKWLNPSILVLYYIVINVFLVPVILVNQGEIMPLKYKGIGGGAVGLVMSFSGAIMIQYSWKMIFVLDIHGMFALFLVSSVAILVVLYFLLPETKGRTLQSIENDFVNLDVKYGEVELNVTQKLVDDDNGINVKHCP